MNSKQIKSRYVATTFEFSTVLLLFLVVSAGSFFAPQAYATVTNSGDVEPTSGFSFDQDLYIGETGVGSLVVESPVALESVFGRDIYLGYGPNAAGTVTVEGSGASLQATSLGGNLYVGYEGTGQLNISDDDTPFQDDGASVYAPRVWIGATSNGSGSVHFNGGALKADTLYASSTNLTGTDGVISVKGLVSDIDLNFDTANGTTGRIIPLTASGQDLQIWLNLSEYQDLGVGYRGNTNLTISEGVTVTNKNGYLGYTPNSTGHAIISGGAIWEQTANLHVGYGGTGVLEITDNAQVIAPYGTRVGSVEGGTGTIQLGSGGTLSTGTLCTDLNNLTGVGTITATGLVVDNDLVFDASHYPSQPIVANANGSNLVEIDLHAFTQQNQIHDIGVGYLGTGSLTITNGATVEALKNSIGMMAGSVGTITVSGPNTVMRSSPLVGMSGTGYLNINNGGTAESYSGILGLSAGSHGTVSVNGTGSAWTIQGNGVSIGNFGNGQLNVTNGGAVTSDTGFLGSTYSGASGKGTAIVSGEGAIWSTDTLIVGYEGSGLLNITNAGLVKVNQLLVIDFLENDDSFINMKWGGMLAIAGQGADSLGSFLALGAPDDPSLGSGTGAIRYWNKANGDWTLLSNAELGTDYTLEYLTEGELSGYTVLTVGDEPVPGDANGDGKVDGSDVTILANNWQAGVSDDQTATWTMGDFNYDGKVDGSDVTILASNWQSGVNTTGTAVPEPGTVALLLTLLMVGASYVGGLALLRKKCDNKKGR